MRLKLPLQVNTCPIIFPPDFFMSHLPSLVPSFCVAVPDLPLATRSPPSIPPHTGASCYQLVMVRGTFSSHIDQDSCSVDLQ